VPSDRVETELAKESRLAKESTELKESSELMEPSLEYSLEMGSENLICVGSVYVVLAAVEKGDWGGVGSCCGAENPEQCRIRSFNWSTVILSSGLRAKIMPRMLFKSSDRGRMVFKKLGFLVKALYVESSAEAAFHGLRPHVRLTRMTPRLQMSLGAHRYDGFLEDWSRHSAKKIKMVSG